MQNELIRVLGVIVDIQNCYSKIIKKNYMQTLNTHKTYIKQNIYTLYISTQLN